MHSGVVSVSHDLAGDFLAAFGAKRYAVEVAVVGMVFNPAKALEVLHKIVNHRIELADTKLLTYRDEQSVGRCFIGVLTNKRGCQQYRFVAVVGFLSYLIWLSTAGLPSRD